MRARLCGNEMVFACYIEASTKYMISRKRISYAARDIGEGYDMQQHIIRILRYQGGVKHIISTDLTQVPSGRRLDGEVWLVTRTFPAHAWYTKYVQYNNYGPLEVEGPQLLVLSICQLLLFCCHTILRVYNPPTDQNWILDFWPFVIIIIRR